MKNITLLKAKVGILAVSCLSITALFACVDKDARSDLSPNLPTDQAQNGDFGDQGGGSDQGLNFPVFDDGVLAFPGAEGYGKNATGARTGEGREIYHVTNLNDAGPGSFRDAVSKPWRIIVFDVSGVIKLSKDPVVLKSNQTILGHTAPGDGIVLYNGRVSASGAQNLIVRYLRIRMGAAYPSDQVDACGVANGADMIFDHCSMTWGRDECFSINPDGKEIAPKVYEAQQVPMNPARPFTGGNSDFRSYCKGNYYDYDKDGALNGIEITEVNWSQYCSGSPTLLEARSDLHPIIRSQKSAQEAYEWVVEKVGAYLPVRDEVDKYLIDELTSLGGKGTIIQDERKTEQFPLGGPGTINVAQKPLDSDNDGMPDAFEDAWGLDKYDPTDAVKEAKNGYLNIENYALSLEYPDEYEYELNKNKHNQFV